GSGSDAAAMRTTAEIKGNEWVLNGTKSFATNASVAKVVIGYARTGRQKHEISAFIIPTDAEGFSVLKKEDKMGIRASDTVLLGFDDMRIPKENLLGDLHKGFNIAMATLDGGRIGIAAQALGIAQRALDESVKYAKERDAFRQKIADFQAIQWKVADMATEIEAARLLTYRAAQLEDLGRRHTYESSVAKLFASEAAHRAVDSAVQIHGGYGFIKDYVVEKLYRDKRVTEIYEATSEIQRLVIARTVLGRCSVGSPLGMVCRVRGSIRPFIFASRTGAFRRAVPGRRPPPTRSRDRSPRRSLRDVWLGLTPARKRLSHRRPRPFSGDGRPSPSGTPILPSASRCGTRGHADVEPRSDLRRGPLPANSLQLPRRTRRD